MIDFAGEIYIRQEGQGMLLGTYEQAGVPWSPQRDAVGLRLPAARPRPRPHRARARAWRSSTSRPSARAGIKKIVNGPFTFSPDGNPLVGPIKGLRNYWVACAVMAGLSQGGGVGLSLANWMVDGDPGADIWGMDVARYGDYATLRLHQRQGARELLAAGSASRSRTRSSRRPARCTPRRSTTGSPSTTRSGAPASVSSTRCGSSEPGVEPIEDVTFRRSNAFDVVAEESRPCASGSGSSECSNFAKYRVTGPRRRRVVAGPVHQPAARRSAAPS